VLSLVDKDEREHARGNGEGGAHTHGEAVAVGQRRARREKPLDAKPGDDRRADDATQQPRETP